MTPGEPTLRQIAEAEQAEDQRKRQERREEEAKRKTQAHRDKAKAVAEWFAKWSGQDVSADDFSPAEDAFPGFHAYATWEISIDGFNILVKQEKRQKPMLEEHTPDYDFKVFQRTTGRDTRPIDKPKDLLASVVNGGTISPAP